jgi:excisionase family DNA binding protein
MTSVVPGLAAAVAAALEDSDFAAAVAEHRPRTQSASRTMSAEGAAELLHLPVTTVRQYARDGRLPGFKAGRHWVFFTEDIERTLRSHALAV